MIRVLMIEEYKPLLFLDGAGMAREGVGGGADRGPTRREGIVSFLTTH